MKNEWKYINKTSEEKIKLVEEKLNYKFKEEFKKFVLENNAGTPQNNLFYLTDGTVKVFGGMLSFNEEDDDYIVTLNSGGDSNYVDKIVAVATDPFGNLICFDRATNNIVYWDHELDKVEYLSDNWEQFINNLTKKED